MFADGKKVAEVALLFPAFAPGTIANLQTRKKEQNCTIRRKRMVQFEDLTIVRKQARLDDLQDLRNLAWEQLRLLLETGCVIDGRTGEVRQVPVDPRLFKAAADTIIKILRTVDEKTGQLPQRVEGWTSVGHGQCSVLVVAEVLIAPHSHGLRLSVKRNGRLPHRNVRRLNGNVRRSAKPEKSR